MARGKIRIDQIGYVPEITIFQTATQKNINGGQIIRSNAYIDMSNATQLKELIREKIVVSDRVSEFLGEEASTKELQKLHPPILQ